MSALHPTSAESRLNASAGRCLINANLPSNVNSAAAALKRMSSGKHTPVMNKHPVQVARRNERERNRVRQVNSGFVTLRNIIPLNGKQKKLSKVETLRQAAKYIKYLNQILGGGDVSDTESTTSTADIKFEHPLSPDHSVHSQQQHSDDRNNNNSHDSTTDLPLDNDSFSNVDCASPDAYEPASDLSPSFTPADFASLPSYLPNMICGTSSPVSCHDSPFASLNAFIESHNNASNLSTDLSNISATFTGHSTSSLSLPKSTEMPTSPYLNQSGYCMQSYR